MDLLMTVGVTGVGKDVSNPVQKDHRDQALPKAVCHS